MMPWSWDRAHAERARIVAADAKGGLVRLVPKLKQRSGLGDLAGAQRCAGQFDHGADEIVDGNAESPLRRWTVPL